MALIKAYNSVFDGKTIILDGTYYKQCVFNDCTIQYSGLSEFGLVGCTFNSCRWSFTGPAANTLNFLRDVYKNMGEFGQELVESTFENIKK